MSDVVGAAAAHRYRDRRAAKARRLGDGEDATKVDASSFTPGEPLDADAKTGMRPVSRQARKDGGAVTGRCAGGRADRPARAKGGSLGESYVNRNAKAANEDRAGRKHDMGLNHGGRAHRKVGGAGGAPAITLGGTSRAPKKMGFSGPTGGSFGLRRASLGDLQSMSRSETDPHRLGRIDDELNRRGQARGGRSRKAGGGGFGMLGGLLPLAISEMSGGDNDDNKNQALGPAPPKARGGGINADKGVYKPDKEREGASFTRRAKKETGSSAVETRLGRASGGRAHRQAGGPLASPISEGMGGQGRFNFNYGPQTSTASKLGIKYGGTVGRERAHERYGASPGPAEHHPGLARASGGRVGRADGGAAPGPCENEAAVGQPSLKHRAPRGENSIRARTMAAAEGRASGGEVAEKALAAHHAEHAAMKKGRAEGGKVAHGPECDCDRCTHRRAKGGLLKEWDAKQRAEGGRAARAKGGKAGTKINIIIAPGGANPPDPNAPPGGGLPPNLALKPPMPAAPMPMPGGAPPPGAPAPMPIPIPMGGGMPGAGMAGGASPPRARGGRAPKVRGETMAGSGSGLGRLQKAAEYGTKGPPGRSA